MPPNTGSYSPLSLCIYLIIVAPVVPEKGRHSQGMVNSEVPGADWRRGRNKSEGGLLIIQRVSEQGNVN